MDIPRKPTPKRRAPLFAAAAGVLAIALVTLGLGRLRAAAPEVERSGLWIATVQRGQMVRQVKGPGSLVPEEVRWITAETAGRVERIHVKPGATVAKDTLILELTNPDVVLEELASERDVASAQLELFQAKSRLETQALAERATVADLASQLADVQRRAEAYRAGAGEVYSALDARQLADREADLAARLELAKRRVAVVDGSKRDEIGAQQTQITKRRDIAAFRKRQVDAMRVRAGGDGLLQDLPLELGQWVVPGTVLARVIRPEKLKAVLRIPELQAKDLQIGQAATIDTHNGLAKGRVARIAPAAYQGTVTVEVTIEGDLPQGSRPDLSVEGTIEIERLSDVLSVERPAGAQPEGAVSLFKLIDGGELALRERVELGRASVGTIEVRGGLRQGDRVILSDMSRWDGIDRIKLR
ncbi:efflux RND transporter periplasmic adaptor subunit [Polyangium jinanense]|uniref:HlyD family efflux transporter periplasmic adaptor subunit n=1 Tax=Polyangium jinanense TaxID=2829994 RepID=A0A9X3XE74_9BACT|nr:HlyD family efflux transporter periplasmic adaptor subunit [Polyangium jinanense]MDC3961932.1 HlyD family efflux transporter periplasmic adaptor subunit [Polyangium jinanense]MDC3988667.1 HlyD family efflux transporter periplasmic adaptor subunit [Polyangium jinanense]